MTDNQFDYKEQDAGQPAAGQESGREGGAGFGAGDNQPSGAAPVQNTAQAPAAEPDETIQAQPADQHDRRQTFDEAQAAGPHEYNQAMDAAQAAGTGAAPQGGPSAAESAGFQTRDEWERRQREIQDREWRNRQLMYNRQLAEQRSSQGSPQDASQYRQDWAPYPDAGYNPYPNEANAGMDGAQAQQGQPYAPQYDPRRWPANYPHGQAETPPYQENAYNYGPGQPQQQTAYGDARGAPYGGPNQPAYGTANQPAYGTRGVPNGTPNQSAYGTRNVPFGAPHQSPNGAPGQPVYGAPNQSAHGAPNQSTYGAPNQSAYGVGPANRREDKRFRKNAFMRVIAAVLAGALILTAIFTAGFMLGNGKFNLSSLTAQNTVQTAVPSENAPGGQQQTEPSADESQQLPGFFGNQQGRFPLLPPGGRNNQGGNDQGQQQQPTTQPPGQQQQQPTTKPAGQQTQQTQPQAPARSGDAAAFSSLVLNPPRDEELTVPEIYQKVYPSIVGVRITFLSQSYRFGNFMMPGQEQSGEGSGIIIHGDGYIMTNHHVIAEVLDVNTRNQLEGTKIEVILPDDSETAYPAAVVGYDQSTDLCVLKIEKSGLKAAELGDADRLIVGESVVAIGNPGGMEYMSSATHGIISGLNRSIQTEGYRNIQLIQTDAPINPGNSGGALINRSGQVIGVNSIKIADRAFEGLGFAIPINDAVKICIDLMNYSYVTGRPYIGITAYSQYTEQMAAQYNMPKGVYVYEVDESGPAVGIIRKNDIIVKFNDVEINNFESLEKEKNTFKPGDKIKLQLYRDWSSNDYTSGKYVDVEIVLGEKRN